MKNCRDCGAILEVGVNWRLGGQKKRDYLCRKCHTEYQKSWYAAHPGAWRRPRVNHPEVYRQLHRNTQRQNRLKALSRIARGGPIVCVSCGYNDIRILEINHKNGGGSKEVGRANHNFYRWIANGSRSIDDLDIRCKVCNALHAVGLKYPELVNRFTVGFDLLDLSVLKALEKGIGEI
jgi:hypothetical protein